MSALAGRGAGGASGRVGGVLYPPANFSMVESGLYRSSFPAKKNFSFLRHLGIRSILTLVLEDYPEANLKFQREHGIALLQVGMVSLGSRSARSRSGVVLLAASNTGSCDDCRADCRARAPSRVVLGGGTGPLCRV